MGIYTWRNEDGSIGGEVEVPDGSIALSPEWQAAREKYRNSHSETDKAMGAIALSDETTGPVIEEQ